jgi:anti-sigma factor RsiW
VTGPGVGQRTGDLPRDERSRFKQITVRAAAPVNPLALRPSATRAKGTRPDRSRPGLTRSALQQRASVFLVPTGIARSIRLGWLSQSAVCRLSGSQGRLLR